MPDSRHIVINTGPLIALVAGMGDLKVLQHLYDKVHVPIEVEQEILVQNASRFGATEFLRASWLVRCAKPVVLSPFLQNTLDLGEAAVIQTALNEHIHTVCIDEAVGRRIARLSGLALTGSVGIMLKAASAGYGVDIWVAIRRMREKGIWVSDRVVQQLKLKM